MVLKIGWTVLIPWDGRAVKPVLKSDDLTETEEIKSQADLDPTRECSEQMNAIDTTVSFKLTDDEIDDMKLSIAKALKGVLKPRDIQLDY